MGIFGWDYPPGCSSVPGDEPWQCEVCGMVDDCCCPECEVCGQAGDPKCYQSRETGGHGMVMNVEQLSERKKADDWEAEQAERDKAEGDFWARQRQEEEDGAFEEERKVENRQLDWSEGRGKR